VKLRFQKTGHRYALDGKLIPSLSAVLDFWFGEYEDHTSGAAADRGTRIHKACEYAIQGLLDYGSLKTESEDLSGYVRAFERFFVDNPGIAVGKPHPELKTFIISPENIEKNYLEMIQWIGCGMRLDLVFRKTNTIVEIKSGIPAKKHFWGYSREAMQLNTQIKAMSSTNKPASAWTGYILYIKSNGEYRAVKTKFDELIWNHFQYAWIGWYNKNYEKENKNESTNKK